MLPSSTEPKNPFLETAIECIDECLRHMSYFDNEKYGAEAREYLHYLFNDEIELSPKELCEIAEKLSIGGIHDSGLLIRLIMARLSGAVNEKVVAATVYYNWTGGRNGFQFLPDPAETDYYDYEHEVHELCRLFEYAGGAETLLCDEDRDFYNSLPDTVTIYRGAAGPSEETLSIGLCWTTRRPIAEWFAHRSALFSDYDPLVFTRRIKKDKILLALAHECEIVPLPGRARRIKCRPQAGDFRPDFEWKPEAA